MELLLLLSSGLPREIVSKVFFRIHHPSPDDFLDACMNGKRLLIEQWIFYGLVDVSIRDNYPIVRAAGGGHLEVVSLLLDHGADPSAWANTPIWIAVKNGHTSVVSLLLEHGADPSANNNLPLRSAVDNGDVSIVSLLMEHGARPTDYDLSLAKRNGHSEVVSILLAHPPDDGEEWIL